MTRMNFSLNELTILKNIFGKFRKAANLKLAISVQCALTGLEVGVKLKKNRSDAILVVNSFKKRIFVQKINYVMSASRSTIVLIFYLTRELPTNQLCKAYKPIPSHHKSART